VKSLTVRLPESLVAQIDGESKRRGLSKSDVVRERLEGGVHVSDISTFESIADLVGAVDGLPEDLSARRKAYLKTTRYGGKRPR
jgi:hypothetical protein